MSDVAVLEPDRIEGAPHPRATPALIGQDAAETAFLAAVASGRLHHAWLLTGPRGVGKATLAWRMARHLSAGGHGDTLDMPAEHPVFRQTTQLVAPSIFLCRRPWDPKTQRYRTAITVDEVRALKAFFQMSAGGETWRTAIVDPADDLTPSAANALLKVLEEPPPRTVLILVCHRPALLLPTLRSRCRELRCRRLDADEMSRALSAAGAEVPTAEAAILTLLADGSVGRAFGLLVNDGPALYGRIVELLVGAPGLDRTRALDLADASAARDGGARFALTLDLAELAVSRLARFAADPAGAYPAMAGEDVLRDRLARDPAQAHVWAETAARLRTRAEAARLVNLDPAQIILDMFLQIDTAASDACRPAS